MKKRKLLGLLFIAAVSMTARATVTLQVFGGPFFEPDGTTLVSENSIGILVADTTGNGFLTIESLAGFDLTVGDYWGDDLVMGVFGAASDSTIGDTLSGLTYSGNFGEGDAIGFYWFPELFSVGGTITGTTSWGFYRTNLIDGNSGADMAFYMPTDGTDGTLAFFHSGFASGAIASIADFTATSGASAVPEPGTSAALMGVVMLGFVAARRKRRVEV